MSETNSGYAPVSMCVKVCEKRSCACVCGYVCEEGARSWFGWIVNDPQSPNWCYPIAPILTSSETPKSLTKCRNSYIHHNIKPSPQATHMVDRSEHGTYFKTQNSLHAKIVTKMKLTPTFTPSNPHGWYMGTQGLFSKPKTHSLNTKTHKSQHQAFPQATDVVDGSVDGGAAKGGAVLVGHPDERVRPPLSKG